MGDALRTAHEHDALTRWRKRLRFRPGERKAAKNAFNRRVRYLKIEVEENSHDE